jgi:hypothetical protein
VSKTSETEGNVEIMNVQPGDMIAVTCERGWFRVKGRHPDGSVTCWGPVDSAGSQKAQWRSFPDDRIRRLKVGPAPT